MIKKYLDYSPVILLADDARALDNGLDVSEPSRHHEIAEGFFLKFGHFVPGTFNNGRDVAYDNVFGAS